MKITYGTDGSWTTTRDGQVINGGSLDPQPTGSDWAVLKSTFESKGAVIVSSLWSADAGAWLPAKDKCGSGVANADLAGSSFSVSNLKITGSIVQGPTPTVCGSDLETEIITI